MVGSLLVSLSTTWKEVPSPTTNIKKCDGVGKACAVFCFVYVSHLKNKRLRESLEK